MENINLGFISLSFVESIYLRKRRNKYCDFFF